MRLKVSAAIAIIVSIIILIPACRKAEVLDGTEINGNVSEQNFDMLEASVITCFGESLLVSHSNGELYSVSLSGVDIRGADGSTVSADKIEGGMTVKVEYEDGIAESYPGQINHVRAISITGSGRDMVSLYTEAVKHIYEEDSEINGKVIALDLDEVATLDKGGKAALCYMLNNYHLFSKDSTQVILGNRETLVSDGMISDNTFNDGVLVKIKEADDGSFSMVKWRSSKAVFGCDGCTAEYKDGKWSISYGEFFIS